MSDKSLLFKVGIFPFTLISLYKEWVTRNIDRTFKGSNLKIIPGGNWKKGPNIPTYRYEFGAARAKNKIFVIGGLTAPTVYTVTGRNEAYDLRTQKWFTVKQFPRIIHHPGVTSDGKLIYVIGGNGLRITTYNHTYSYHPKKNVWTRLTDIPTGRCAFGLVYSNNKIYAVGGADNKKPLSSFEEFDIRTNTWKKLPNMPTKREHLSAVSFKGKIYALGGYQNDRFHNVNALESYDTATGEWERLSPVPAKISGFTACVWGNSIYVFGGEQGWAISGEVYEYKINKDKWIRRKDLPVARYASASAPGNDGIHVLGGNIRMMSHTFSQDHDIFVP